MVSSEVTGAVAEPGARAERDPGPGCLRVSDEPHELTRAEGFGSGRRVGTGIVVARRIGAVRRRSALDGAATATIRR